MVERKCPFLNYNNLGGILEEVWFYLSLSVDLVSESKAKSTKSTQRDLVMVCFYSWVGIKLSGLAPLRVTNS